MDQGLQQPAEGLLNAKQPLLPKQMLAAASAMHLQHDNLRLRWNSSILVVCNPDCVFKKEKKDKGRCGWIVNLLQ